MRSAFLAAALKIERLHKPSVLAFSPRTSAKKTGVVLFPERPKEINTEPRQRGRPKGTRKLDGHWWAFLLFHAKFLETEQRLRKGGKQRLSNKQKAELLKKRISGVYRHVSAEWIRQSLSGRPPFLDLPTEEEFTLYMLDFVMTHRALCRLYASMLGIERSEETEKLSADLLDTKLEILFLDRKMPLESFKAELTRREKKLRAAHAEYVHRKK